MRRFEAQGQIMPPEQAATGGCVVAFAPAQARLCG